MRNANKPSTRGEQRKKTEKRLRIRPAEPRESRDEKPVRPERDEEKPARRTGRPVRRESLPEKDWKKERPVKARDTDKPQREYRKDKPERSGRPEKPAKPWDKDKPEREYKRERPERGSRTEKPEARGNRERPEKPWDKDKPEREYKRERPERGSRTEKPDARGNRERPEKPWDKDKPEREYKRERPERGSRTEKPDARGNRERPEKPWDKDKPEREYKRERPARDANKDKPEVRGYREHPEKPWDKDKPEREYKRERPERESKTEKPERSWKKERPEGDEPVKRYTGERRAYRRPERELKPGKELIEKEYTVRLNKYIADAGICSRREADKLIEAGAVSVNGIVVKELGTKVTLSDRVQFGDQTLSKEKLRYVLLNKPKGYITSVEDPHHEKTVMSLVAKACKERIYPVGRLDRNTTGVLLLTNDGQITKKLSHPRYGIRKIYHVVLDKSLTKTILMEIRDGIVLDDGPIKVDVIEYAGNGDDKKEIGVELHSGKNRIVRRIFEKYGYNVVKLDRVVFAGLTKKNLPRGHWRFLEEKEVNMLKMLS